MSSWLDGDCDSPPQLDPFPLTLEQYNTSDSYFDVGGVKIGSDL
ncbi:hypothetical protein CASFOL_017148 [Castilleja foliolosa]|uniref:Uncharacterized protein n=1 Tax=Castilleja foliolosa TaxID=1961234 RepID=A0ABD3DCC4_9LAMI